LLHFTLCQLHLDLGGKSGVEAFSVGVHAANCNVQMDNLAILMGNRQYTRARRPASVRKITTNFPQLFQTTLTFATRVPLAIVRSDK
jgi:hypothetical protein